MLANLNDHFQLLSMILCKHLIKAHKLFMVVNNSRVSKAFTSTGSHLFIIPRNAISISVGVSLYSGECY